MEDEKYPKKKRRKRTMKNIFITITGQNHYLGLKPYKVGRIVKIVKDVDNEYDEDAIRVELPFIDTIGYVANSVNTVFAGTHSAGKLYDKIGDYAYAQVMFITHSSVIALVLSPEEVENNDKNKSNDPTEKDTFEINADTPDVSPSKIGFLS
jgi:hypothetical protein